MKIETTTRFQFSKSIEWGIFPFFSGVGYRETVGNSGRTKQLIIEERHEGQGWTRKKGTGTVVQEQFFRRSPYKTRDKYRSWWKGPREALIHRGPLLRTLFFPLLSLFLSLSLSLSLFPPDLWSVPCLRPSLPFFLSVAWLRFTIPRQKFIAWKSIHLGTDCETVPPFVYFPLYRARPSIYRVELERTESIWPNSWSFVLVFFSFLFFFLPVDLRKWN